MTVRYAALIMLSMTGTALGQQVFTEVSESLGITVDEGLGHSAGWCDIDGDGDLDLACSNQDGSGFWLYRNDVDSFTDITASAGLGGLGAYRILWGEVTGDGYSDLILDTGSGQALYENQGDGTFTDISSGSGLTGSPVCVLDFDNDGFLDVLVLTGSGCSVLQNAGEGTFAAGPSAVGDWWCAACLDFDLDGDLDIYLGTYGSDSNSLLRNDQTILTDVTASAGVQFGGSTEGITTGDYNNDGLPDIYLGNYSAPGCLLFQNDGDGTFTDVTAAAGVFGHDDTRTVGFVDYDNDGWLDIFVSHHDFYTYSNIMWHNDGDGTFTDTGEELGLSGELMGDYFGTAWGDYNLDGDVDLFAVGHIDKYELFRNDQSETMPAAYVVLELEGTLSNRDAVGARVVADLGGTTLTRWVTGGEGYHDFHSFPVELGLYDSPSIQSLEIHWPSGTVDSYADLPADQYFHAVEGDTLYAGTADPPRTSVGQVEIWAGPNPFAESVTLHMSFADGPATLEIYDLTGRMVRRYEGVDSAEILWDGRDWRGRILPGGVYVCRMMTPAGSSTARVTLLR